MLAAADVLSRQLVSASVVDQQNTKWKRLFNAVATVQNRQQDGLPLLRLISEVMRPVCFSTPAEFEERRRLLNERLLLSGFKVAEDGRLHRARAAATLSEAQRRADDIRAELSRRGVHPDVLAFCRAELMQQTISCCAQGWPRALPTSSALSPALAATAAP